MKMNKTLLAMLSLLVFSTSFLFAQEQEKKEGSKLAKSMEDFIRQFPMEEIYLLPEFTQSILFYKDGTQSQSMINICSADQSLRFIDPKGDTLVLMRQEEVRRILADQQVFIQANRHFFKELMVYGQKTLAMWQRFDIELAKKHEAIPASSTAKVYQPHEIFRYMGFPTEQEVYYESRIVYVLIEDGQFTPASPSSFRKMFPDKKKEIKSFIKENDIQFNKKDDVISLFYFCTQQ